MMQKDKWVPPPKYAALWEGCFESLLCFNDLIHPVLGNF